MSKHQLPGLLIIVSELAINSLKYSNVYRHQWTVTYVSLGNVLSPVWHQAILRSYADLLLIVSKSERNVKPKQCFFHALGSALEDNGDICPKYS